MLRVGIFQEDLIPVLAYRLEPRNGIDDIYAHVRPPIPHTSLGRFHSNGKHRSSNKPSG